MSYRESKAKCDWCNSDIDSDEGFRGSTNGNIACRECYESLESRVHELEKENAELREKIEAKDNVEWTDVEYKGPEDGIPVVTHSGILQIGEISMNVYQLNNGKRVIDSQEIDKIFGELLK